MAEFKHFVVIPKTKKSLSYAVTVRQVSLILAMKHTKELTYVTHLNKIGRMSVILKIES